MSVKMNNPWKARRVNFRECEENGSGSDWGWWQIYARNIVNGIDYGIAVIMDFNLATQTDEIPDIVQECLDAHNSKLGEENAKEKK
jgi:hypothetical protein